MKQDLIKNDDVLVYRSTETGLTAQQEKCAVLMASGISISDIAKMIEISRATIYRWLSQTTFKCFLNFMKQDAKNHLEGSLLSMQAKAIDTIKASLDSESEAIKIRSAMWVMDKVEKMVIGETDAREVLFQESRNWWASDSQWERTYKDKLKDAGLSE